ncbi:hypothetical protein R8Z57_05485 [Microbacterium sp. M3]|uniref:Uncharacterized protein n=1 Tax=Microbacterium arthrosphaerae TaxID=792652 RepID=A0ABU4GYU2_9MICO|nr:MULTISPECIES: hypothetical protein [Microbacterium]MDW4572229.1 hypothetical protein [Microbacterium arthrosphaerae]MDW7606084.1 hypothetical protein [Microbacterium sp. M3]
MDLVIVLMITLAVAAAVLVWAAVHWFRTRPTARNDLVRAGDPGADVSSYRASRRAEGEAAWTRISGGI